MPPISFALIRSSAARRIAVQALTLLLAACGGGGGSTETPSVPETPASPSTPTVPPVETPTPEPEQPAAPTLVVVVGDVAVVPSGARRVASLQAVDWTALPAGAEVRVGGGAYAGPITITAQGTAAQPIVLRAADPAQPPVVDNSLDFQQAAHVKVSGFTVDGSPYAAVVIRRGSHHITVDGNTLRRSAMGVSITDGAGTGQQVLDNLIEDHATVGIAVDQVNADAADPSRFAGNVIRRNGHHGIEVHGSHYVIEHNTVSDSGLTLGGTSGIHLFSRSGEEPYCDDNQVRYNFSFDNHDRTAYDGNGIQVDQWCDRNTVAYNVVWGNDGAGIIVFDGADNIVHNNTARGNGQDPKRIASQLGEIIVSSQGSAVNRSRGNQVFNNLLVPTRAEAPGLWVDYTTAAQPNTLGPNLYAPRATAGSVLMRRGSASAVSASDVDRVSGSSGNLMEAPSFADASAPLSQGLRLVKTPSAQGRVLSGELDLLGVPASADLVFLGAYFTAPGL